MKPNFHKIVHDPDTPLPVQSNFKIWTHLPPIVGGLFILLTRGEFFIAYLGPFIGAYAIWDLWNMISKVMKSSGATHYEIFDPKKNAEDAKIQ